jgi:nucleoside-diphosphate-sugar epimerase
LTTFLITGGCGFLGLWLTRSLVSRGEEVILYDVNINDKLVKDIIHQVKVYKGSITSSEELKEVLRKEKPNVLVHYAALLSSAAEADPRVGYEVNISSTWPIFDAARTAGIDSIIFASSIAAYGPGSYDIAREDMHTIPTTVYGISKIFGELVGIWFCKTYGIRFLAFRYGSVIGPGRRDGGASAYSQLLIQKPAQRQPYTACVPQDSRIPIVYVKDAVEATLTAYSKLRGGPAFNEEEEKNHHHVFNVASLTPSPTAKEIADAVRKHLPRARISFEPKEKETKIVNSWPKDMSIARLAEVGWKPRFGNLESIVSDFISEVRQNPDMFYV